MSTDLQCARVYLAEARKRRQSPHAHQRQFAITLLGWAASARLRHVADRIIAARSVAQGELFDQVPT